VKSILFEQSRGIGVLIPHVTKRVGMQILVRFSWLTENNFNIQHSTFDSQNSAGTSCIFVCAFVVRGVFFVHTSAPFSDEPLVLRCAHTGYVYNPRATEYLLTYILSLSHHKLPRN